jgi:hypothetical protein
MNTNKALKGAANFSALDFVQRHLGLYIAIWDILGRQWSKKLDEEATWGKENIPTSDHGWLNEDLVLSEDGKKAILDMLAQTELFKGASLTQTNWRHELILPGAKFEAMVRRAKMACQLLSEHGFQFVTGLFGQRPRTDKLDGTVDKIYTSLPEHIQQHPWVQNQWTLKGDSDAYEPWEGPFATEYELGILAFIIAFDGAIEVGEDQACRRTPSVSADVPERTVDDCALYPFGYEGTRFTPAVIREHGEAPPTNVSTTQFWIKHYPLVPYDEVVVASVRVHWYRILGEIERIVHVQQPRVHISGVAEAVSPEQQANFFAQAMGEMVWLLQKAVEERDSRMR